MKKSSKNAITRIKSIAGAIRTKDLIKAKKVTAQKSKKDSEKKEKDPAFKNNERKIHPRTFYELRNLGYIRQMSRGVYFPTNKPISNPDLVIIGLRAPKAIVCLISALAYHKITTQIPRKVSLAISKNQSPPKIDYPPISVHKFSGEALTAGIEKHVIDGVQIQIYNIEKTLADCFKFRNKIGLDICIEALKLYKSRKNVNIQSIIKYAKICRVYKIMIPHLEAIL